MKINPDDKIVKYETSEHCKLMPVNGAFCAGSPSGIYLALWYESPAIPARQTVSSVTGKVTSPTGEHGITREVLARVSMSREAALGIFQALAEGLGIKLERQQFGAGIQ